MQPLNHDMDDLMRKAAAGYPVKPQGADWEKVAQQLQGPGAGGDDKKQHGFLKKLLLVLPFLLAGFVCDRFMQYAFLKNSDTAGAAQVALKSTNPPATPEQQRLAAATRINKKTTGLTVIAGHQSNGPFQKRSLVSAAVTPPGSMDVLKNSISGFFFDKVRVQVSEHETAGEKNSIGVPVAEKFQRIHIAAPVEKKTAKKRDDEELKKLYVSALVGPDVSRVKGQQTKPAGYNLGLIIGYRFVKRLAVEGGVVWDKKKYYSKGAYFKTDHVYLPQHSNVLEVDGFCTMFELPLNLRYNLVQKKSNRLFVTAGASSYLMHKEDYDYVYNRYGVNYAGNKVYKGESKNWLAAGNLSLGWEQQLGKISIRIEPYIKIPLKGVGIGSLPISSKGLLVGITHPLR